MTVNANDLPRSFPSTNDKGSCPLCSEGFEANAAMLFYLTVRRLGDGSPDVSPEGQVHPSDAKVPCRPEGCTCRSRTGHGKRCALYVACACPSRNRRRGRGSYVRHKADCSNKLTFNDLNRLLPGFWDHCVHATCAAGMGLEVPANSKVARGSRVMGRFNTGEVGVAAEVVSARNPVTPAPEVVVPVIAAPQGTLADSSRDNGGALDRLVAESAANAEAAQVEVNRPNASWVRSFMQDPSYRQEREAAVRAREEARQAAADAVTAREEAEAAAEAARVTEDAGSMRFASLDLGSDDDDDEDADEEASERFLTLDLS